ncbi:MAG: hypothetical protein ABI685_15030 [Ferruginibacter sp.]
MAQAGYSETPLLKKLGIKPEMKVLAIHPPENYFQLLNEDLAKQYVTKNETPDFIHLFAKNTVVFKKDMITVLTLCKKNSSLIIWVSWYKKTAGIPSDLSENIIRDFALQHDLVDIKVCAVSNEWSGLKLVVPVAKR